MQPISNQSKTQLLAPHTIHEIHTAIQSLCPWKAPDMDGLPVGFYKDHWETIGLDIQPLHFQILTDHTILDRYNFADLVFVPKSKNADTFNDFRPMGLCNTIYKIISKILCNRITKVFQNLIFENQRPFIKSRNAFETTLVGLENLHQIINYPGTLANKANIAIKLDLSKAFDRVQ